MEWRSKRSLIYYMSERDSGVFQMLLATVESEVKKSERGEDVQRTYLKQSCT